ncbi:MAG TPA: metal-dependent hydrolase [Phycisphaeraceae bacterium]
MPSPLAHGSLIFLVPPLLERRSRFASWSTTKRWVLYACLLVALGAPDLDFLLRLALDQPWLDHGGATHSLAATLLFAIFFAVLIRATLKPPMTLATLALLGGACCGSHLLLDFFTRGRGLMLFWPVSTLRWRFPVPLFYGAEHSHPWAIHLHLITLVTESAFAYAVWLLARRIRKRQAAQAGPTAASTAKTPARDAAATRPASGQALGLHRDENPAADI